MGTHHRLRSSIGANSDPYFNRTVLLLSGNGTNGAQNNTFTDSSSNNFTITRNGNTTQGSFTPFSLPDGWWSNYFDGSGDYLSIANNAALQLGSSDWTIECWIYLNALSTTSGIYAKRSNNGYGDICIVANNGNLQITGSTSGTSWAFTDKTVASGLTAGSWYHVAVVRNGSSITGYVNGVSSASQSVTGSLYDSGQASTVGSSNAGASQFVNGYISNFRLTKSVIYTANFTPPTSPLTAITNTQLLTCQSNRFIDNSSNAFAITKNGDVAVQAFSPFASPNAYDSGRQGGSGYFDGNGDNLTAADNAAFEFGSGSFSIDCYVYIVGALKGYQAFVSKPGATDGNGWNLFLESNNTFRFIAGTGGSWTINIGPTVAVPGQWYHLAITRDTSNQWRLFLNGKLDATTNNSFSQPDLAYPLYIGKYPNFPSYSSAKDFGGYMTALRIVKGGMPSLFSTSTTTVGTQVFTPPDKSYDGSESLTAGSVSLLMNYTNGGITDSAAKNDLETVGNAQVSTSVKKYGTGSLAFDGTGDYLTGVGSTQLKLGTGDFTIEFWIYFSSVSGQANIIDFRGSGGTPAIAPVIYRLSGVIRFFTNGADRIVGTTTVATGQWYHIALTRSGTSTKLFLNGSQEGSTYTDSNNYDIGIKAPSIGSSFNTNSLNGNIADLRVTLGVARYTANFTPPQQQLPSR